MITPMSFKRIGVVGGGTMGSGICQVCAQAGHEVVLIELDNFTADAALNRVKLGLARLVKREQLSASDAERAASRIHVGTDLNLVSDQDLVIEAVYESVDLKKQIFQQLDVRCAPRTVLASNTSTIPIVILGAVTNRSDRVVGMHFFNPVPMMKLVEIIAAPSADSAIVEAVRAFAAELGKCGIL